MTPGQDSSNKVTHVVAATDLSELGARAVLSGLRLARVQPKAELHVIAVAFGEGNGLRLPWDEAAGLVSQAEGEEQLKARIAALIGPEAELSQSNVERISIYLTNGNPAQRIVQLARLVDADLIVCGTHGRTGVPRLVLGSVAEEVVRSAPCSVLVIRPTDFFKGDKIPDVEPKLKEGQHSLQPFHRAPTHHYRSRSAATTSRLPGAW